MSDIIDGFRAHHQRRKHEGRRRRKSADEGYERAAQLAMNKGMRLAQHSETHYSLTIPSAKWRWELYPGNQRIYTHGPWKEAGTPFLQLHKRPWTLLAVVSAAADQWERDKGKQ